LNSTPVEPEPQKPFKGKAFDLTAPIEAEDFDIPGKGAGNNSYVASGSCDDTWNTTYREGTSVSIGEKNGGLVLGCNPTGNYYQYTIKVPEAGNFIVYVTVAADGEGALVFKNGDKVISDTITYTGDSWTKFETANGHVTFDSVGEQILTLEVAKGYIDIDKFEFMVTDCAPGDASCGGPSIDCSAHPDDPSCQTVNFDVRLAEQNVLQDFKVYDTNGKIKSNVSGYTAKEAIKNSKLAPGLYILTNGSKMEVFVK
jgi:hypothetical protein